MLFIFSFSFWVKFFLVFMTQKRAAAKLPSFFYFILFKMQNIFAYIK